MESISQRHVPETVMVAIGLTIGGNMNQLGPRPFFGEDTGKTAGKVITTLENILKGDTTRNRTLIEKESQVPT